MTQREFESIINGAILKLKKRAPYDTGNLSINSIKFVREGKNKIVIYVDEKIAPYMPYTNEPWISPKWNGKKNPNEGWWDNGAKIVVDYILKRTKGEVEK